MLLFNLASQYVLFDVLCVFSSCTEGMRMAARVSSLKFPEGGGRKVLWTCHNDDILFATLDCENDENYYHHYLNWGTQKGDWENIETAPKFTRSCSSQGLKLKHHSWLSADRWETLIVHIYLVLFNFFKELIDCHVGADVSSFLHLFKRELLSSYLCETPKETDTMMVA